jgi:Zn-dependent protease
MGPYPLSDLKDKIKRYYKFSDEELKALIITIAVIAFIVSFRNWGPGHEFQFFTGLKNLFISLILVAIVVLVHDAGQRIAALDAGFLLEYKLWWYGILIGIILIIISNGKLWFLAPGGVFIHHMATHRMGFFRYGTTKKAIGMIALAGPIANILFGSFFKTIALWTPFVSVDNVFIDKIFIYSWAFAAFNLLPIPPLDGSRVFNYSRMVYAFIFGSIAGYAILIAILGIYSFIWALIIGIIIWLLYYILFERKF